MPLKHSWDLTPKQARALQEKLRDKVRLEPLGCTPKFVAGCDHAYLRDGKMPATKASESVRRRYNGGTLVAGIVVLSYPALEIVEKVWTRGVARFPYLPGLLSFREGPALLKTFRKLKHQPDVVVFDGQGLAHPRGFGLASHMGVCLGLPSIGCAKSRLIGVHREPGKKRGSHAPLTYKGKIVGEVLRTRDSTKPVYVSMGHRINLSDCRKLLLAMSPQYRIPEPTRQAHLWVELLARRMKKGSDPVLPVVERPRS